jgi:hypothetical protein
MKETHMGQSLARIVLGLAALSLLPSAVQGQTAQKPADVLALAARIDRRIDAGLAAKKGIPAPLADDAEFLRRVYLDLAGRIPHVSEARAFLADKAPDKRRRLVDRLLDGPQYVNHFSHIWRTLLLPNTNPEIQFFGNPMENWVRARLLENVPYDRMVRDLLTTPLGGANGRGAMLARGADGGDPTGVVFYQANEIKPENVAAATSRLFLGVKLECAQCHDHPFARWSRKQFWEYTAFFAGIRPLGPRGNIFGPAGDNPEQHEILIPGTEKTVQARFLDGAVPAWKPGVNARSTLADWMTSAKNPYFARAGANRIWAHFFGIGLIDPVEEFSDTNPPSHPELLDDLADSFVRSGFDLKFLCRAITTSQTYQRSSIHETVADDPRLFARMALKGLTAEQLFDSLAEATGYRDRGATSPRGAPARADILTKFADPSDKRTEHQTSILQALALMNGRFIADATSLDRSETLAALLDSPFMDDRQRLETLFLAALSRQPRTEEMSRFLPYVQGGGPSHNRRKALADVFWVLLNSSEFILNH